MSSIVGTSRGAIEGQPSADGLDCSDVQASSARTPPLGPRPQRVAARQLRPRRSGEKWGREQCEGEKRDKKEACVAKRPRLAEEKEYSARRRSDGPPHPDLADGGEGGDAGPDAEVSSSEEGVQIDGAAVVHAGPPGQRGESIGEEASPKRGGNGRRATRSAAAEQRRTEEKRKNQKASETPCVSAGSAASSAAPSETPSDTSSTAPGRSPRPGIQGGEEAKKNFVPPNREECHPALNKLYDAQQQFLAKMVEENILTEEQVAPLWNLFYWEWSKIDPEAEYIVVLMLNYQTKEQALDLGDFHSSAACRANGERAEKAWRHQAGAVGEKNFVQTIRGDVSPLSYMHETSIEAEVGEENAKKVMYWWDKIVLSVLRSDERFKIAFCSSSAVEAYAKHVLGGSLKDMDALHVKHPGKYLSLEESKLAVGCHPCSIYRTGIEYRANRPAKCLRTDMYQTLVKRAISRDPNAECTYYVDTFVDNGEDVTTVHILISNYDNQSLVSADTTHEAITTYFDRNVDKICKRNGLADRSEARVCMCFDFMCYNAGIATAEHRTLAKALQPVGNDPGKLVCEKMKDLYERTRAKRRFKSDAAFLKCMKRHQVPLRQRKELSPADMEELAAQDRRNKRDREQYAEKRAEFKRIDAMPEGKRSEKEQRAHDAYEAKRKQMNEAKNEQNAKKRDEYKRIDAKPKGKRSKKEQRTHNAYEAKREQMNEARREKRAKEQRVAEEQAERQRIAEYRAKEPKRKQDAKRNAKKKRNQNEILEMEDEEGKKHFQETGFSFGLASAVGLPAGWSANTTYRKIKDASGKNTYYGLTAAREALRKLES